MKLPLLLTLEKAINAYISLDESCQQKLTALRGKVCGVSVTGINLTFYFVFLDHEIKLQSECIGEPDVFIQSPPFSLFRLFASKDSHDVFYDKTFDVKGNVNTAQAVKAFFASIDIDWEAYLSRITGDVIAHQAGKFASSSKACAKQLSESLQTTISEYLQEELRAFPPEEEVRDFFADIVNLRNGVERLDLRIKRLKEKGSK